MSDAVQGVEEGAVEFRRPIDLSTADRFRRIAGVGPVYEVLALNGDVARVRLADADEEFDYTLAEVELDPPA